MKRISLLLAGLMLFSPAAWAAEYSAGGACSTAGAHHQKNDATGAYSLVCNGSVWVLVTKQEFDGTLGVIETDKVNFEGISGAAAPVDNSVDALNDLSDVSAASPTTKHVLTYNGSNWVAQAGGSGLWTAGTGDDIYYSSGTPQVGIGTATPKDTFHVKGFVALEGDASGPGLTLNSYWDGTNDRYLKNEPAYGIFSDTSSWTLKFLYADNAAPDSILSFNTAFEIDGTYGNIMYPTGQILNFNSEQTGATTEEYRSSDSAFAVWHDDGNDILQFLAAPSGTSGNTITWNEAINIDGDGNVGIGDTTPDVELDVVGDINYTGVIQDVSDRRLKENITPLSAQLSNITALKPVSFTMKDDKKGVVEYGLIAQEVEAVYPVLVGTSNDEMATKAMNYMGLIAPMIAAMQEQQAQIEALKEEVRALKTKKRKKAVSRYND